MAKRAKTDDNVPTTAKDVLDKHQFAKGLYLEANDVAGKVEDVLTEGIEVPKDVADAGNVQVAQMVLARAILERLRQMLQVEASLSRRVMPQKPGEKEAEVCQKIERWLSGYDRRHAYETKSNYQRDATFWYLLRGVCRLEVRFAPDAVGRKLLPIQTLADDPKSIFPVRTARDSVLHQRVRLVQY